MALHQERFDAILASEDANQIAHCRHLCEQLLEQDGAHGPTWIVLASCLTKMSLFQDAEAALDRAEAVVPSSHFSMIHAQRGHRFRRMGQLENEKREHLAAHNLSPQDATYLIFAGAAAVRSGELDEAEALFRKALTCPEGCFEEAHFNLGGIQLARKRYTEARNCYLEALRIDPDYVLAKQRLTDVEWVLQETVHSAESSAKAIH